MSRGFLSGLRGRLLLLVLLALLPALGFSLYTSWVDRRHQRTAVVEGTVRLARAVAGDQERVIEGTRQILSDLAALEELRAGNQQHVGSLFGILMKQWRGYASFTLIDRSGAVVVGLPQAAPAIEFSQRPWFRRAVETGEFTVGEYQIGRVTGRQVVVAALPVVEQGVVGSVIAAALDLEWLNEIAAGSQLPAGAALALLDRQGAIVAHSPAAPQWIGRRLPDQALVRLMREQSEGSLETAGDGAGRVYAFTPVRGRADTGLRVVIGVPSETAFGPIERSQSRQLLLLVLVAGLALALFVVGAERFVLRRVASLIDATRRLAAGDPAVRTALPYGAGELGDLARAFDEMASALQAREAERWQAERALRDSQERFRAFMDNTPAIAFLKDEVGRWVYANATFERFFGLGRDQWFGRTDHEIRPSSTAPGLFDEDDRQVLATGQPRQRLGTLSLPGSRPGYWMTVRFPLTDVTGRRMVGGVAVDLTDWRLAQEALARSERRYEQLVEQAWDGIMLVDAERRLLSVNSAACAMTGYARDELLGMRADDLLVPADRDALMARDGTPLAGVVVSELTARRKDGSTFLIEVTWRQLESGHVQAIIRDVTDRHASEQALRASEERYRLLYQYLPVAYQSLSLDGEIVDVNEAWVALTGRTRDQAIGSRFDVLLTPDSQLRFLEGLARVARAVDVRDLEVVLARPDRTTATLSVSLRLGADRERQRVHCVLDDVTAARTAAARLRESEERYRSLFADSPISLWVEDLSGIERYIERLRTLGVTDLAAHFDTHPDELADCVEAVRVVDVNHATLALYHAETRSQMLAGLDRIIGPEGRGVFAQGILALARGARFWKGEGVNYTLDGDPLRLELQWSLAPGDQRDWSRVVVSAVQVRTRDGEEPGPARGGGQPALDRGAGNE